MPGFSYTNDSTPSLPAIYKTITLKNDSNEQLAVNGSVTPVNFDFTPASGEIWYVESISLYLEDGGNNSSTNFGALSALTNGVDIRIRTKGTEYTIATIKNNAQLCLTLSDFGFYGPTSGFLETSDTFLGSLRFSQPMILDAASSDYFRVRIQDNLTGISQFFAILKVWGAL